MSSIRSILEKLQTKSISNAQMTDYFEVSKANKFVIDQALKDISELIDKAKPEFIFDDGNNDATWAYKKGVTEYQNNLKELFK